MPRFANLLMMLPVLAMVAPIVSTRADNVQNPQVAMIARNSLEIGLSTKSEPAPRPPGNALKSGTPGVEILSDEYPELSGPNGSEHNQLGAPHKLSRDPNAPLPEIGRDLQVLPEPVRAMRQKLIDAARSGDIERLRPLLSPETMPTRLSLSDYNDDPIGFLKSLSGDDEGREILAIMVDLLETGYVHIKTGTPEETYVWPYFYGFPLDRLSPSQQVEMFQIVTAGDFEDMKKAGGYIFYSIGIAPDGSWRFFSTDE